MSDITCILRELDRGDPQAANALLPLVYDELRKLAAAKLAFENPGQTLSATALVHEAYLRLLGSQHDLSDGPEGSSPTFDSRGHFFAAAADAMRRILIEAARRRKQAKRGGGLQRVELSDADLAVTFPLEDLLIVDEALDDLAEMDRPTAELVKLHCFAGVSIEQAAGLLGISVRSAYRDWAYARAWLFRRLSNGPSGDAP